MSIFIIIGIILTIIAAVYAIYAIQQYRLAKPTSPAKPTGKKVKDNSCERLTGKIVRWIMFSIVLSLLPLGMKILSLSTRTHNFFYSDIVSHGELLLITITMCTTAIAELFCSGSGNKPLKLMIGSLTISILIIASGYFSDISVAFELNQAEKFCKPDIFVYQLWLFGISFVLGIFCIFLSEK